MKKNSFRKYCLTTLFTFTTLISMSACTTTEYVYVPTKVKFDASAILGCPSWETFVLPLGSNIDALIVNGADRLLAIKQCNETIDALKVWNETP